MELHEIPGFEMAKFEILPIEKLFVDSYQRNVSASFVGRISKKFSPVLVGVLICSDRRNGTFSVIDGQHRFEIMKTKGITHVPCFTFPLNVIDEALSFIGANKDRNTMTATSVFWASVEAKDPVSLKIKEITEDMGFYVTKALKGSGTNPRCISAVGALNRVYVRFSESVLRETLEIMSRIWINDPKRLKGIMLIAIGTYINSAKAKGEYDKKKLISCLSKTDLPTFQKNLGQFTLMFNPCGDDYYGDATKFIRGLLGNI